MQIREKRLMAEYPTTLQLYPIECLDMRGKLVNHAVRVASRPATHISTADPRRIYQATRLGTTQSRNNYKRISFEIYMGSSWPT